MKISMICFSLTGQETGERLAAGLRALGHQAVLWKKSRYLPGSVSESTGVWTGKQFQEAEGVIFVGACGIAVRSIAPYAAGKMKDPAVLVIDECGKFVISLLSGHLGGANRLAAEAAGILGAQPVITTATDLHQCFAVDMFAKENDCSVFHMEAAKKVSAALLAGGEAGFYSDFPFEGELPRGLVPCDGEPGADKPEVGIAVTVYKACRPFPSTVSVVPKAAALGIGCRKGKSMEEIRRAAEACLEKQGIYREALEGIASISIKKEEPGIVALAAAWKLPFRTFDAAELREAAGNFTPSAFVEQVAGVDNVCERSAVLLSGQGRLLMNKLAGGGVTAALALRDWRIRFE